MSFGARVLNQSGFLQIDQDYSNYVVAQAGTVSVSRGVATTLSYPNDGALPILFVKYFSTTGYILCPEVGLSSALLTLTEDAGPANIPYILCRSAAVISPPTDPFGFVVKNSAGQATFDSRLTYPRIAEIVSTPQITQTSGVATVTFSNPRTDRWLCISQTTGVRGFAFVGSPQGRLLGLAIAAINETQVRVALRFTGIGPPVTLVAGRPATLLDIRNP